jgi:dinuclear metal center YbgI/SA1388 family protein
VTLTDLDKYLRDYLAINAFPQDPSRNGIQVANSAPASKPIKRVAFAVDACLESVLRAVEWGADLLFVHHGLLWGSCEPIAGAYRGRIKALLDADMALYACHLPLDAHSECGNNYGMAQRLALVNTRGFGTYHGMCIGAIGETSEAELAPRDITAALFPGYEDDCNIYPFGKTKIRRIAIVSGGAGDLAAEAVAAGADCLVTGELLHQDYHSAEELGLTIIAAGHYRSETVGVTLMAEKLHRDLALETRFLDLPTGL